MGWGRKRYNNVYLIYFNPTAKKSFELQWLNLCSQKNHNSIQSIEEFYVPFFYWYHTGISLISIT